MSYFQARSLCHRCLSWQRSLSTSEQSQPPAASISSTAQSSATQDSRSSLFWCTPGRNVVGSSEWLLRLGVTVKFQGCEGPAPSKHDHQQICTTNIEPPPQAPDQLRALTESLAAVNPCTLPLFILDRLAESQLLLVWLVCRAKPCRSKGWQIGLRRSPSKLGAMARWQMSQDSKVTKECQHTTSTCLRVAAGMRSGRQSKQTLTRPHMYAASNVMHVQHYSRWLRVTTCT